MNAKSFGATIAALRRKKGYTQAELAEHLSLSNKTVSKWENGQGYPDITTLPTLAKLFGVTVDELLSEEKSGIAVAGTVLVDIVHNIDRYPTQGMLANILSSKQATGGCMPNTTIDLAVIDNKLPLSVWGCVETMNTGDIYFPPFSHVGSMFRVSPCRANTLQASVMS